MTTTSVPYYLTGEMAPVPDEIDAVDLEVTGKLPPELSGRYFRNGPNPLPGTDPGHGFTGQGMLHGVHIRDGKAQWYRNRWVHTPMMDGIMPDRSDPTSSLTNNTSNTSVIHHAGKILSLVENGGPAILLGQAQEARGEPAGHRLSGRHDLVGVRPATRQHP